MRRTGAVGVRFPGPSPAVVKAPQTGLTPSNSPQKAIAPAHTEHGLPMQRPTSGSDRRAQAFAQAHAQAQAPQRDTQAEAGRQRAIDSARATARQKASRKS